MRKAILQQTRRISKRALSFNTSGVSRLSKFWTPTGGIAHDYDEGSKEDSNALLVRGGFVRQSHAGIFHFLPLGHRVRTKIERVLDKHMGNLNALKLDLSTLSSAELWEKSGRLQGDRSELFRVEDRKATKFLLAPTHEEEVTVNVGNLIQSYKDLPLRVYQVSRKYRDELRPRQGLLRAREFLMKDLYTFDISKSQALTTYHTVRQAYSDFFDEFKVPYIIAEADSGNIGGDLSHEYHIESDKGEDVVYICQACNFTANEEILEGQDSLDKEQRQCKCLKCSSGMKGIATIELGHTFYLGTKYSEPLGALVDVPKLLEDDATAVEKNEASTISVSMEMGCHGIGVSRLIAGIASILSDKKGLNWPRAIAPFEAVIISSPGAEESVTQLSDQLSHTVDVIIDDRDKSLVWKMKDADLIGYPVMVIFGRSWAKEGKCEVQCRRLNVREDVRPELLLGLVESLLAKL